MDFKHAKRNRRFDHWIMISLLSSLVLGLNFLSSKVEYQVDLTPDSKFSLSKESLARLDKMIMPIDIIITLRDQNKLPKVVQKLVHDLKLLLDSFENAETAQPVRIYRVNVDSPNAPQELLEKYKISEPNLIIIATPDGRKKTIFRYQDFEGTNPYDLSKAFRSKDSQARQSIWESGFYENWIEAGNGVLKPTTFRGEEKIMRDIIELAGKKTNRKVAYFSRGHGEKSPADVDVEKGYSVFRSMLEDRNVHVSSLDLSVLESIPEDAQIMIIAGPKATFQDKEIAMLRNFINNENGSLLIAIDPTEGVSLVDRPAFGFRPLLKEWGIRCHDMLVYDPNRNYFDVFSSSYSLWTYPKENPHPVIKNLRDQQFSILTEKCRPVEIERNIAKEIKSSELIYSSKSSWALSGWPKREFPPVRNTLLDLEGPVPIISVAQADQKNKQNKLNTRMGRLAVLGSSSILTNQYLKNNGGNKSLSQNLIHWLKDSEEMLDIPPKEIISYNISMTSEEFDKMLYSLGIVPGAIALIGIFVGWLRKEL